MRLCSGFLHIRTEGARNVIKDLLLNVLTILASIFAIQALLLRWPQMRLQRRHKIVIGLLGGMCSILCMTFPVRLEQGFIWDFRWVLLTAAILYGGIPAGLISVALFVVYRFALGGPAMYFALIGSLLLIIVPFLLGIRFNERTRGQRFMIAVTVSLISFVYTMINIQFLLHYIGKGHIMKEHAVMFGAAGVLQLVLTLMAVYFIENAVDMSRMKYEVHRTELLITMSELAASVAHEVRNPLTVVRGFLQMAKKSMDLKVRTYMEIAIGELDRAEFIISDYLSLAKPQAERLEIVNVEEKISSISALMSSFAAMQNVELKTNFNGDLFVRADGLKFGQVIINLVKNAIEASGGQGNGIVQVSSNVRRGYIVIEVSDDGVGMSEEQLKRLGSSYFTTKENGTGLGIMVAFRIVQAMDGKLEYESEKGQGTVARITLPPADREGLSER